MKTYFRRRASLLAVPVVAGAMVATSAAGSAAAGEFELVLDTGHIDAFTVLWEDETLALNLQEDVTGYHVLHPPEDVLLQVKPEALLTLPDPVPPSLEFLGAPGDTVYYLPQTQDPNLIWPGWSTERVPAGEFENPMQIQISDVEGPGDVFLWQTGSFGQSISVLSGGGYQLPGTIPADVNVHVHANWGFTEPGRYTLTVNAAGMRTNGSTAASAPATYTFQVGDEPPPDPDPTTSLSIDGLADHYHSGDVVTLTAVQDPVTDLDHYHWFTRAPGTDAWVIVPDAGTEEYSFTATANHNGLEVLARLYNDDHDVVAESDPVTIVVDDHGQDPDPPGDASQRITATLPEDQGALVVSVDPEDNVVTMSDFDLAGTADRLTSTGELRPVTVTDTRSAAAGWVASGQVSDFTADDLTLPGKHLGWTPAVAQQPDGGGVTPGDVVAPGLDSGDGLAVSSPLASAGAGSGVGTSVLGADLLIEAPTTLAPGTYEATITFTAI